MEIVWYGQSCFRLRSKGVAVVTDPYAPEEGIKLPRLTATMTTISCDQPAHNNAQAVKGGAFVIDNPGEYEIEGVFCIGVATNTAKQPRNTAYLIEFEDLIVCHLGNLEQELTQEQLEQLGDVDVLLVPVVGGMARGSARGGVLPPALSCSRLAEVVSSLDPRIVLPMHYRVPGHTGHLDTPDRLLKELGVEAVDKLETLTVTKGQLPAESRVILLEAKQ